MSAAALFLIGSLCLAVTAQAQTCSRPVGGPNMGLKGDDILSETFADGAQVSFACDVGYTRAGGSPVIICTAGSWSPVKLICERKNCGTAGEVAGGVVDYPQGTEFGDKAVITCNHGLTLVGSHKITCGDQGWDSRLPTCEEIQCDEPNIANAEWAHGSRPPYGN